MRIELKEHTINIVSINDPDAYNGCYAHHYGEDGESVITLYPYVCVELRSSIEEALMHELVHAALHAAGVHLREDKEEEVCQAVELLTPLFSTILSALVDKVVNEPSLEL